MTTNLNQLSIKNLRNLFMSPPFYKATIFVIFFYYFFLLFFLLFFFSKKKNTELRMEMSVIIDHINLVKYQGREVAFLVQKYNLEVNGTTIIKIF